MKTAIFLLAIITITNAEEVPLPQGPGTPIDQLGSQALQADGYRDTTAWSVKTLAEDQEGETEEIELNPRVITERVTAAPRVLTETVRNEPKVITENITAPIRQKIITQPTVLNMNIKANPEYFQQDDRTVQRDAVYLPPKYKNEVVMKPVDVPGNTITNVTQVQPVVKTIREEVQIQNMPEVRKELDPIYQTGEVINNQSVKQVRVPANTIWRQDDIKPMYYRENVRLNVQDSAPKTFNNEAMELKPKYRDTYRIQEIPIFGKTVYKQNVIQPVVTNEQHQIRLNRAPTQYVTYDAQVRPVHTTSTSHRHIVPVTHNIPQYVNVPVQVPVAHVVPQYVDKFVRYEVKEPENVYRNVSDVQLNVGRMRGRGLTVNSGPGFYNRNYSPIDGDHGSYSSSSSSDGYHGRRHGYGHRHMKRRLDNRAYDISDLYYHQ